ncbi:MAG: polysaccharide deacetylase family protein [bacterium]
MSEICSKILLIVGSISVLLIFLYLLDTFREEFRKDRILTLCYQRPSSLLTRGISKSGVIYLSFSIRFEEQIGYLFNHGYQAISIHDLLACQEKKQKLPSKPLLIILDNAYLSNYLHLYPIIRKYDFPAAMLVTPDPKSEVFAPLRGIDLPLTNRQLSEMSQGNILIGSHGLSVRPFSKLSEEELMREICESKRLIEDIIDGKVEYLAIPANDFLDKRTQTLAQNAGYKAVLGNHVGTNNRRNNPFNLRKLTIKEDMDLSEFIKFISPVSIFRKRILFDIKTSPITIKNLLKSFRRKKQVDPKTSANGELNG